MTLSRFVPQPLIRSAKNRLTAIFSTTPLVFLGVVVAVAFLFRVGIGLVKSDEPTSAAPIIAPNMNHGSVAHAARAAAATEPTVIPSADPAAMPLPVEAPVKGKRHRSQFPRH